MGRVLFAWEMGSNFGHLARDLPLALACRKAGHDVVFAVSDLRACKRIARLDGLTFLQAPVPALTNSPSGPRDAINYADLLLKNGFSDVEGVQAGVLGWTGLFRLYRPHALVYDFAPMALLAARLARIPVLLLGNGFETPPNRTPLPSFRPWQSISEAELFLSEATLLDRVNATLTAHGSANIERLWDLYSPHPLLIAQFPEFDHFGPRTGATYVGTTSQLPSCERVEFRGEGRRVLVYLRSNISRIESVLIALSQLDAEIVCVVPDLPAIWPERYRRLRFFKEPIDLAAALPGASMMVTHGSGTFADAVLAGVPVLMVPSVIEQYLAALPLERQGVGLVLRRREAVDECVASMRRLLSEASFANAAEGIATRYRDHRPEQSVDRQFRVLRQLIEAGAG